MKRVYASIIGSALVLSVIGILNADVLTGRSVTDAYISGALDARLEELGTNNMPPKQKMPQWKKVQNEGVRKHCVATQQARAMNASGCAEAFIRNGS